MKKSIFVLLLVFASAVMNQNPLSTLEELGDIKTKQVRTNSRSLASMTYLLQRGKSFAYDAKKVKSILRPGDIVFFSVDPKKCDLSYAYNGQDGEEIDYLIERAQTLSANLTTTPAEGHVVHVGIYLGKGKILESVPRSERGIRTLSINSDEFELMPEDIDYYQVYRVKDPLVRSRVLSIAKNLLKYVENHPEKAVSYSNIDAIRSVLQSKNEHKQGAIFTAFEGQKEPLYLEHTFCSYMVAWIMKSAQHSNGASFISNLDPEISTPGNLIALFNQETSLIEAIATIYPPNS